MKVEKKELEKSQIELTVELSVEEFKPFLIQGAEAISQSLKIDGFRPGKAPYDIVKQKVGEMGILEEAANIAIRKKIDQVIKENVDKDPVGQPQVDITKLAPENPLEFKIVIALLPEITLGEYKDLKIKQEKAEALVAEVEKTLNDLREMRTKEVIVEREVQETDKIIVDIEMFLDNVPVEGGKNKDTAIMMGREYVVPGFDKKLIGAKKGETREFSLPYPEDFHMKNLAGKMVEFRVVIKEVYERELPELNDDLAMAFGLKKIEELKENIEKSIAAQKEKDLNLKAEREMLEKIINNAKFSDIAEILINHESQTMMAELEHNIEEQGGKLEDYLSSLGKNMNEMMLELMPEAVKRVKVSLTIREIAK
ncbi:MAG: trigger factor, partial [Candidatus Magasanikbacteria bacterium]|nr:trigger factor [Candidatus Magasanikbacteria bacterium]